MEESMLLESLGRDFLPFSILGHSSGKVPLAQDRNISTLPTIHRAGHANTR